MDFQSFNIPTSETPEQAALRKQKMAASALTQGMPQNMGQGINALGQAMIQRGAQQNQQFPAQPINPQTQQMTAPDFGTRLGNLFGWNGVSS